MPASASKVQSLPSVPTFPWKRWFCRPAVQDDVLAALAAYKAAFVRDYRAAMARKLGMRELSEGIARELLQLMYEDAGGTRSGRVVRVLGGAMEGLLWLPAYTDCHGSQHMRGLGPRP